MILGEMVVVSFGALQMRILNIVESGPLLCAGVGNEVTPGRDRYSETLNWQGSVESQEAVSMMMGGCLCPMLF